MSSFRVALHLGCLEACHQLFDPEEINFSDDIKYLSNLPPDQLHFLSIVLDFFAISDMIVADNLSQNFMTDILTGSTIFYGFQLMMENIHNETYFPSH
jgi:ribonucleotide reductase beta subunit family protein with ferritin-like domain